MSVTANAWTTLADVQEYLALSTADGYDDQLEKHIEAVSDAGRAYLGYDPYPQDYVEWHDGESQDTVILTHWPVIQVNALSDDGDTVGELGEDYHVYPEEGLIRLDSGRFCNQRRGVYVHLYAGLSPWIPEDLRQAANEWVQAKFAARGTGSETDREVQTEKVGDYQVTYGAASTATGRVDDMPKSTQATLERYRAFLPGAVK